MCDSTWVSGFVETVVSLTSTAVFFPTLPHPAPPEEPPQKLAQLVWPLMSGWVMRRRTGAGREVGAPRG